MGQKFDPPPPRRPSPSPRSAGAESAQISTDRELRALLEEVRETLAQVPVEFLERTQQQEGNDITGFAPLVAKLLHRAREGDRAGAANTCIAIAQQAESMHRVRESAAYYEAAVHLDPNNAISAYRAGRLARRRADYGAAEGWFQLAVERGTACKDWNAVAFAYSGLGNLQRQSGAYEDAAGSHMRSLGLALKNQIWNLVGDGYHNLSVLSFETGAVDEGVSYARKALDTYGGRRDRIAALASDLAFVWLTRAGSPERALLIFREVLQLVESPAHRLHVLANIARATGYAGDAAGFDAAVPEVEALMRSIPDAEGHATAMMDIAYGAAALGRQDVARRTARQAKLVASARQELQQLALAGALLENLGQPKFQTIAPQPVDEYREDRVNELVLELMEALR